MGAAILFVCTGNICRSPMAERLLVARTFPGAVTVSSAGTYGLNGHAMDSQAAAVTRELGADPDGHVARELTTAMVDAADLVLTATAEHRDHVMRMSPRAMRRVFTMREFVRLAHSLAVEERPGRHRAPADRVADVAGQRGLASVPEPGADDIGDPYGGTLDGMRACGAQIAEALDATIGVLGFASGSQMPRGTP